MKKILLVFVLLWTVSCDDGDLDISSFEFEDEVTICGTKKFTLYRMSTVGKREVFMVTLTDLQIRKDEDIVLPVAVSTSGDYTVTYRLFETDVSDNYFCAAVPPSEPTVIKDWRGVSGTIIIDNQPKYAEDGVTIINWEHIIVLHDVVLKVGDEELKLDETFLFGSVLTGA